MSNTKSPFQITLKNGSSIKGFTTGAASGGGADNIRGQRADSIYLDESDYMNDSDFDSIMALQGERSGISVFLSSTPTGARKRFWKCCTDPKMHFKEFHYPSMCNPDWSPEMEEEFRAQLSEAGYKDFYKPQQLIGITDMQKLLGKKKFEAMLSEYLIKPPGKPVLVPVTDARPEYNSAADDFEMVEGEN